MPLDPNLYNNLQARLDGREPLEDVEKRQNVFGIILVVIGFITGVAIGVCYFFVGQE